MEFPYLCEQRKNHLRQESALGLSSLLFSRVYSTSRLNILDPRIFVKPPQKKKLACDYVQGPRLRELGLLDEFPREILRYAQDDTHLSGWHPFVILSVAKDP